MLGSAASASPTVDPLASRLPVTVITGFLGSGKTTLLRRLLRHPGMNRAAVIINEFGDVGIDHELIAASSEQTTLLGNGCLCCNTRSDLQNALRRLVAEREQGTVPPFKRIVIETSGLADMSPILQTFSTDRALGSEFAIEVVLTVVDAVSGLKNLEKAPEARKQAILADRLVITKTDIAGGNAAALSARLRTLNPGAEILQAANGALDPSRLTEPARDQRNAFVAEAEHSDGIVSFVLTDNAPIPWPVFARTMDTLMAMRGPDLLRVKGFLNVEGCAGPVVVQFVQHLAPPPVELAQWPDGNRASRVVFITRNVSEKQVRELFAAVRGLS